MTVGNGTWETAIEAEGSHEEETETAKQLSVTKIMLLFVSLSTKSYIVKVRQTRRMTEQNVLSFP